MTADIAARADRVGVQRTLALFLTAAVLFGGTFVAAKAGLAYLPPLLFVAIRFDIGAVVLASYAAVSMSRSDLRPRTVGDVVGIAATGLLVIGFTNVFLFVGQQYTTSGVAAIVFSLNPILTPVFAAVLLTDERFSGDHRSRNLYHDAAWPSESMADLFREAVEPEDFPAEFGSGWYEYDDE